MVGLLVVLFVPWLLSFLAIPGLRCFLRVTQVLRQIVLDYGYLRDLNSSVHPARPSRV